MCGKLRFENTQHIIGAPLPATNLRLGTPVEGPWSGFARTESIDWWRKTGRAELVTLQVTGFDEQGVPFRVGETARVLGILLGADVELQGRIIGRAGELKVVTRAAETKTEKEIHGRWPVVLTPSSKSCYLFNEEDKAKEE